MFRLTILLIGKIAPQGLADFSKVFHGGGCRDMLRVFASEGPVSGLIELGREEAHHLVKVRRVQAGEIIEAFDGAGNSWRCDVAEFGRNHVVLRVHEQIRYSIDGLKYPEITIASAVPKGDRFDWLIEKAVELGVSRFIPLKCDRSVVDPRESKLERIRQSIIEACKQSGRNQLMEVHAPVALDDYLDHLAAKAGDSVIYWADMAGQSTAAVLSDDWTKKSVSVLIGPEGGWSDRERNLLVSRGVLCWKFADNILRIETAAIAAASILSAINGRPIEPRPG